MILSTSKRHPCCPSSYECRHELARPTHIGGHGPSSKGGTIFCNFFLVAQKFLHVGKFLHEKLGICTAGISENFSKRFLKTVYQNANSSNVTFQKHTKGSPIWSVFRTFSGNFPRGGGVFGESRKHPNMHPSMHLNAAYIVVYT